MVLDKLSSQEIVLGEKRCRIRVESMSCKSVITIQAQVLIESDIVTRQEIYSGDKNHTNKDKINQIYTENTVIK